jgi:hypothetical protein
MATQQNRWAIGEMYYGGLVGGQVFFTQPLGPSTAVTPSQQNSQPWTDWPVVGLIINEYSPFWAPGCGHSCKELAIVREFDYETNKSVALICCNICYYVQRVIEPFEEWLNPIQNAIIIA